MSKKRTRKPKTEYQKLLDEYRKLTDRHVLVLETDMIYQERALFFHTADLIRKAGNELTGTMNKRMEQLFRTKRYRKLQELYKQYKDAEDDDNAKGIGTQMNAMKKEYGLTWDECRQKMILLEEKYNICSIFALTKAESIWKGVEQCLYGDGEKLSFKKRGDLPCIQAKQYHKGIIIKVKKGKLCFSFENKIYQVKIEDIFQQEEVDAVIHYLNNADAVDKAAVEKHKKYGTLTDTFRPCYASIVCEEIRGKMRVYLHITIEGKAKPKKKKDGTPRHTYGAGNVGCDIGTQTIAYTSDEEVGLKNLAERGKSSIQKKERAQKLLQRSMERSRRAMNPEYYNEDGTIKKGLKHWKYSNRYKKKKRKFKNLCRINAENRHLAINEDVNHLRSLGDVFITEPKNAKKLQKRAKKTEREDKVTEITKKDGTTIQVHKYKRKKRFGKSIQNRCPGYFQAQVQRKFEATGGKYIEVPSGYKASQYDHTADDYIKKKLSDRLYALTDGTVVQRDWYSSFLLYSIDFINETINKQKCMETFKYFYEKELALIETIRKGNIKVLNSGIA